MTFAFCLFRYFPFGGLQRDFLRIAQVLLARGHTVTVYTMKWEGEQIPGLTVHVVPVAGWQNHTRIRQFTEKVRVFLQEKKVDCIVGFNKMPGLDVYYAADTCFQAKARQQHGAWYRFTPRYLAMRALEESVFGKNASTRIFLIAPKEQAVFMRYYQTPAQRFYLLPPGIARDRMAPPDRKNQRAVKRKTLHITAETFLLLFVGSGFKTKGLDRVLHALASLPVKLKARCRLMIVGRDHQHVYQQLAQRLQIAQQIDFAGGRDDIPELMLAADVLVHPARNENTGTVLLEAVIAGLPVLTTDVCGYADYVVQAGAGQVLSSPFDQKKLTEVLQDMLLSPNRQKWSENGQLFGRQADLYSLPERAADLLESFVI